MKRLLLIGLLVWTGLRIPVLAQDEVRTAAMSLSGAAGEEEADPDWVERLEAYRLRPLRINGPGNRLLRSGILSPYQVAALTDYRSAQGDILSAAELTLIDGFSPALVETLRPFLSFSSSRLPGAADTVRIRQSALVRTRDTSVGAKYKVWGRSFQAGGAWRGKDGTAHLMLEGRRSRLLVGDFHVRYGQGVAHWSGFAMTSLSSLQAFSRRPTGLSPVWSYAGTGTHRGAAADTFFGPVEVAVFADWKGFMGTHAGWVSRNGELGAALYREDRRPVFSLDGRWQVRRAGLFGEWTWKNGTAGGVSGVLVPAGEHSRTAFRLRILPSRFTGKKYGEYGLSGGWDWTLRERAALSWTVDAALLPIPGGDVLRLQAGSVLLGKIALSPSWKVDFRVKERYRSYERNRLEARGDLLWQGSPFQSAFRLHVSCSRMPGFLTYWEGGLRTDSFSAFLRLTGVHIRTWADRIWCYERDAPGNFSVPAYAGTGGGVSFCGGWKHRFRPRTTLKCYLRAEGLWRKEKPGKTGLRMQVMLDL